MQFNLFSYTNHSSYPNSSNINNTERTEKINNYAGEILQTSLTFSPELVHRVLTEFTLGKKDICEIKKDLLGKDVENLSDPNFKVMKDRGIKSPVYPLYDLSRLVQIFNSDLNNKLLQEFMHTNILSNNDEYNSISQNLVDIEPVKLVNSGINAVRYNSGIYQDNSSKFFLKFGEAKYHVITENFSLQCGKILGIKTANARLINVNNSNGISSLGIKTDILENFGNLDNNVNIKEQLSQIISKHPLSCVLFLMHMIIFKNTDGIGRDFGNLNIDKNTQELILLDAGATIYFRGMGQLKDLNLTKAFNENIKDDFSKFSNPDINYSSYLFINSVKDYLNQNPQVKTDISQQIKLNLKELSSTLENSNFEISLEYKDNIFPILKSRIDGAIEVFKDESIIK